VWAKLDFSKKALMGQTYPSRSFNFYEALVVNISKWNKMRKECKTWYSRVQTQKHSTQSKL
jgi:hypothetical protein